VTEPKQNPEQYQRDQYNLKPSGGGGGGGGGAVAAGAITLIRGLINLGQ
jgi:hypothetical protein